jgi:hypothetical protein
MWLWIPLLQGETPTPSEDPSVGASPGRSVIEAEHWPDPMVDPATGGVHGGGGPLVVVERVATPVAGSGRHSDGRACSARRRSRSARSPGNSATSDTEESTESCITVAKGVPFSSDVSKQ